MKKCQDCGAEIEESIYVCPHWGYKFENREDKIQRINERFQYDMQEIKKEFANNVLAAYAEVGWRLHTAVDEGEQILFVFERRVKTNAQVVADMDEEIQRIAEERSTEIQNEIQNEIRRTAELEASSKRQRNLDCIVEALKNRNVRVLGQYRVLTTG